jgi:hypothetical protein
MACYGDSFTLFTVQYPYYYHYRSETDVSHLVIFLKMSPKAKLKNGVNKAVPHFRSFWTGNMPYSWWDILIMLTSLYVSFKHILINLTRLMGVPNSLRVLYNIFLQTESWVFFKSMNSWCVDSTLGEEYGIQLCMNSIIMIFLNS